MHNNSSIDRTARIQALLAQAQSQALMAPTEAERWHWRTWADHFRKMLARQSTFKIEEGSP